jgi:hypothetical protein
MGIRQKAREGGLQHYFTGKPCKHGHIAERRVQDGTCLECRKDIDRKYSQSEHGSKKKKEYGKSENYVNCAKRWRDSEGGREKRKANRSINRSKKYSDDSEYRMRSNLSRLGDAFRSQRLKKSGKTFDLTGCTFRELIEHLEGQFQPGMTLDNYGEWQIDHIIPCASFDLLCPLQQRLCFGFWNLQPLWVEDHREKTKEDVRRLREMVNG